MAIREMLPTLTEDEVRSECERITIPSPIPSEAIRRMMAEAEAAAREPAPSSRAAPASTPSPQSAGLRVGPPKVTTKSEDVEEIHIEALPADDEDSLVEELVRGYLEVLGSRTAVPWAVLTPEHARALQLDHWTGFVLALVDGRTSVEEITDAAPMAEHETLRRLCDLVRHGIIDVRPPRRA